MEFYEAGPDVPTNLGLIYHPYDSLKREPSLEESEELEEPSIEIDIGRFQGHGIPSHIDFSDMVCGRQRKRVGSVQIHVENGVEEHISRDNLLQRFHHLQHDVKQLLIDIEKHTEVKEENVNVDSLGDLAKQLEFDYGNLVHSSKVLTSNKLPRVGKAFQGGMIDESEKVASHIKQVKEVGERVPVTYELYYNQKIDQEGKQRDEEFVRMERRVAKLENYIGPIVSSDSCCIEDTISNLEARSKLLSEDQLRVIHSRLSGVLAEIDNKKLEQRQQDINLGHLYEMLKSREETERQIPIIATRLHAIRGLHERSAKAVQDIETLKSNQTQIDSLLKEDRDLLLSVRQKLNESISTMDENLNALRSKVDNCFKDQQSKDGNDYGEK